MACSLQNPVVIHSWCTMDGDTALLENVLQVHPL